MPRLVSCEFRKLRRRKFLLLTVAVAFLFPIPLTAIAAREALPFNTLFRMTFIFGDMLFLPCVLGILAAMLFLTERDSDTLKNLLVVPVSRAQILAAKLAVLLCLSVVYSVAVLGATLFGGMIVGGVQDVGSCLAFSILAGVLIFAATLPAIVLIVALDKNYVVSVIVSFVYAVICFGCAYACMGRGGADLLGSGLVVLPIVEVFRWYLGFFPLEEAISTAYLPYTVSTPHAVLVMAAFALVFSAIAAAVYRRDGYQEV